MGLVQGACFADTGNDVICMDVDQKKIRSLQKGTIPIFEPGLEEMVKKNLSNGRLQFTVDLKFAVHNSKIVFLCLPTPQAEDGSADLSHILKVAEQIADLIPGEIIIVSKSTVPVGTVDRIGKIFWKKGKTHVDVVSNPEFLKEGAALQDSLKPDRIIIGSKNQRTISVLAELYSPFVRTGNPILVMDERSAEMTKYAANAFLATKISFMNDLANLCERAGADIDWVRKGIGSDPRIGQQFLFAGIGYGGSCFPKDVRALLHSSREFDHELRILHAVDQVNEDQKRILFKKISNYFGGKLKQKSFAVWGLSFKPNTDDLREAPSLVLIDELLKAGAKIRAHDPVANKKAKLLFDDRIELFENNYETLNNADALVILTEWNEFRRPDFERMKSLMGRPVILDGRNIYDPKEMKDRGFVYIAVGRGGE